VPTGGDPGPDLDHGHAGVGVFDRHDRIRLSRQGGPGHDAGRRAPRHVERPRITGRNIGDHRQPDRKGPVEVGGVNGIPIHRGVVETGQIEAGDDGGRAHQAPRLRGRDRHRRQRRHKGEQGGAVVLDGAHHHGRPPRNWRPAAAGTTTSRKPPRRIALTLR